MIRLGGTIESVLARLKEKTFELNESKPVAWFEGSTMMSKIVGFPSGTTRSLIEIYANVEAARSRGTVELFAEGGNTKLASFIVDATESLRQVFLELETSVGGKKRVLLEVLENGGEASSFLTRFSGGTVSTQSNRINWGTAKLKFTASTNSVNTSITHGLGEPPVGVLCIPLVAPAFGQIPTFNNAGLEKTTAAINGEVKTAFTGEVSFMWVAFL